MAVFSPKDWALIEAQKLDLHARIAPSASATLLGLVWSDEMAASIAALSHEGDKAWKQLFSVRSLIHAGYPVGAIPESKDFRKWYEYAWKSESAGIMTPGSAVLATPLSADLHLVVSACARQLLFT
jgi:hypothetical protein